ncbi:MULTISPECIES: glucose 1-dehydrogenase [Edaphosphingomonas]|uniref:3-oxoacyl-ACP reductase n=2 Tax=Edaphosphingomonas TaxID=3423724 RepID=A0A2T4I1R6_9SPHN|nr:MULTISPECIES: glucose 1-dehydrogenase [Sphingomonas]OHT22224.1 3-alpha-(or 20-beta)-hydroxysteroid dehydrogenase [Sphingomonas haloaromaticamans]PTD22959.1 3-oxoacyl-ACP reductase [Sphingomonas fennica]
MRRLENKVAIVTGGARGIGEGIVRRFVAEGARVVIADVLDDAGRALAAELGDVAAYEHLDVTSRADWDRVIAAAEARFGRIDSLVNNAGIIVFKGLDDLSEAEMRRIIDVNLMGVMIGTQAVIPAIERAGGGSIINMSSADGISGANALTAYCASKFGVRGFTKAAALELGPRGIRVNSIHPGGIYTPLANPTGVPRADYDRNFRIYPAQRAGDPADIGAAAAYLASDDAAYCIGTELSVDGGLNAGHYYMGMPGAPVLD